MIIYILSLPSLAVTFFSLSPGRGPAIVQPAAPNFGTGDRVRLTQARGPEFESFSTSPIVPELPARDLIINYSQCVSGPPATQ
eukprot:574349-Hanusia_phi.AAC.6